MKLSVVTPEKKLITDEEIEEVTLPGHKGELNILPGHAALMTTLTTGAVEFKRKDSGLKEKIAVSWGYCEIANDVVNILAETAESSADIDLARAEAAYKNAEKKLESPTDMAELTKFSQKRERALVRISVARMNN